MKFLLALLLAAASLSAQAQNQWLLTQSSLAWHVVHPMHEVQGASHDAKGKGICNNGECEFLVAVPVNTFHSGDSNRDLHMIEVVRGAQFPMVVVRAQVSQDQLNHATFYADLEVQFAGQTVNYKHVPFQRKAKGGGVEITGSIPATCTDFKITPPSFLMVPIHNDIPVTVDLVWQPS